MPRERRTVPGRVVERVRSKKDMIGVMNEAVSGERREQPRIPQALYRWDSREERGSGMRVCRWLEGKIHIPTNEMNKRVCSTGFYTIRILLWADDHPSMMGRVLRRVGGV